MLKSIKYFFTHLPPALLIFSWISLFGSGIVVGTERHRNRLNLGDNDPYIMIESWIIVISCYTMTNVAILCCLSAVIGGIFKNDENKLTWANYAARGLFVYLILISGLLLLGTNPMTNFSSSDYIRTAGTASLFSFISGYSPSFFGNLTSKIESMAKSEDKK